jgi:hypothetical protein
VFVEHSAPDGKLRMWYPNNRGVVKGSWGVSTVKKKLHACFSYSTIMPSPELLTVAGGRG